MKFLTFFHKKLNKKCLQRFFWKNQGKNEKKFDFFAKITIITKNIITQTYMTNTKELRAVKNAIIAAENSLKTAKALLYNLLGEKDEKLELDVSWLSRYNDGEVHVVEGVFTGENMLGPDGNTYPVPHNYASKSLLVQGSKLKAIIQPSGKILYKIIEEIEFESKIGMITKNGEKFQITTKDKTYNVLVASVTFHKCQIGDSVTVRIPKGKEATYAIIENVIPKS